MKVVVDSNILFSFFNPDSDVRELLLTPELVFFTPEATKFEVESHSEDIRDVANITREEFEWLWDVMFEAVQKVPLEEYDGEVEEAFDIVPDRKDVAYFALALSLEAPVWSNESGLKQQDRVEVLDTGEMMELVEEIRSGVLKKRD
ncbi:MAG: PIN domain-containing protein [Candidatus Nanohaloarchaea archaeon]